MTPRNSALVRRIGAVILGVSAILVMVLAGPSSSSADVESNDRALAVAQADYRSSNARTSGAPQQQVVNGWFARDALTIQVGQLNELISQADGRGEDERLPFLALIAVLGLCLLLATTPVPPEQRDAAGGGLGEETLLPPPPQPSPFESVKGSGDPPLIQEV